MLEGIDPFVFFAAGVLLAAGVLVDTTYQLVASPREYRRKINRRLSLLEGASDRAAAVVELRRDRGLDVRSLFPGLARLRREFIQSGLTRRTRQTLAAIALASFPAAALAYAFGDPLYAAFAAVACLITPPVVVLLALKRRRAAFTRQFPEAIDIIVRSLRAGHPVPVAIQLAARELPDPVGTEFGIVEDELTYGLDMETAMRNMSTRVGHDDLPLFVTSIAVQASAGGNLSEILEGFGEVLRARIKTRRKIRALSAEGRASALILTAVPILLFAIVNWMAPDYYGQHWGDPLITTGLSVAAGWMVIGNFVMYRMINFRL